MSTTAKERSLPKRLLPFLNWAGEWRDRAVMRADIVAGVTVALVLIPQSMAYAQLAGLPVYYGLYAAFLPPAVAALFGSSRQLATGPVALASLLTAATLQGLVPFDSPDYIRFAVVLAFMIGAIRLALGVLHLGWLANLLSHPVVVGFTNGTAIIIATSQLDKFFGVQGEKAEFHFQTVWNVLRAAVEEGHWPSLAMGVLSVILLASLRYRFPRMPYVLITAAVTTLLAWLVNFSGDIVGDIPRGLPPLSVPSFEGIPWGTLVPGALTITLLGLMEAMSIAKAMAVRTRQRINVNQELIGQGLSNLVGCLTSSYAVSGSFSRSAVNLNSGAVTGLSSVVTSLVVGITLMWFTPLLYFLPQATLAAIILMAVASLVRFRPIGFAYRTHPFDGIVAVITFALTLVLAPKLHFAIGAGILLATVSYLYRTMHPVIAVLSRHADGTLHDAATHDLPRCRHIAIIRCDAGLYFINSGYFEDKVLEIVADTPDLQCLVIDASGINRVDSTGEAMLFTIEQRLRDLGIELYFTRTKAALLATFEKTGFMDRVGREHFFRWNQHALEHAWAHIDCDHRRECPLYGELRDANHECQSDDGAAAEQP